MLNVIFVPNEMVGISEGIAVVGINVGFGEGLGEGFGEGLGEGLSEGGSEDIK